MTRSRIEPRFPGPLPNTLPTRPVSRIRTLYCWVLSKEVSSTIFKVFGMRQLRIEPRSPGPLPNTLPTWPVSRIRTLYCRMLSKEVSSTIFKVFGMRRLRIEPRFPGPLPNTLPTWPVSRIRTLYCWMLSKEVSSTIFKVFGMRWLRIEPRFFTWKSINTNGIKLNWRQIIHLKLLKKIRHLIHPYVSVRIQLAEKLIAQCLQTKFKSRWDYILLAFRKGINLPFPDRSDQIRIDLFSWYRTA